VKEVSVSLAARHQAETKILNTPVIIAFNVFPSEHKTLSLATLEDTMEQVKPDGSSGRHNPMTAFF